MATPRSTRNNATGTLAAAYTAGSGSFTLTTGHGARFAGSKFPIYVTAVENPGPGETIKAVFSCTGVSGDTMQGILAANGETDTGVTNGATIECRATRQHFDDLIDACTNSVAITGGQASTLAITSSTINSTPIGDVTPAVGTFTTLTGTANAAIGQCFNVTAAGGAKVTVTSTVSNVVFNASSYTFQITATGGIYLDGKVGVNTGTPLRALHISGTNTVGSQAEILITDTSQAANSRNWSIVNAGSQLVFRTTQDDPAFYAQKAAFTRSGNFSIVGTMTAVTYLFNQIPGEYFSDSAAESGGIPIGGIYRTGNTLKIRLV